MQHQAECTYTSLVSGFGNKQWSDQYEKVSNLFSARDTLLLVHVQVAPRPGTEQPQLQHSMMEEDLLSAARAQTCPSGTDVDFAGFW